jgi:hypothetical protein
MSFSLRLESLDRLTGDLGEVAQAFRELEGLVANVPFNANDDASVEAAIKEVNEEVDRRTLPFLANDVVQQVAGQFKENAAEAIRLRARQARRPL